jgi:O-antigen/teichoic acid export membrane protein
VRPVVADLVRKGVVFGLGSSLNALVGFVLLPFVVVHLSPIEYGRYAIAEMVLNFLIVFLGLGMNVAVLARYPKLTDEQRKTLLSSVFGFLLLTTLAIEIVFALFALVLGNVLFPELSLRDYALVGGIGAAETIWLVFATIYRAQGAAWRYIATSIVQVSVALVLTVVLISQFGFRESGLLYGRLAADVIVLALLAPEFIRYRPTSRIRPAIELTKIGLPLIPVMFATMWVVMSPRFFLERMHDTHAVGSYAIDSKLAGIVSILFVQPFGLAWMAVLPRIALQPNARTTYSRIVTYYTLVGGVMACVVGLLAPLVAGLLGREEFPISPTVILVLAFSNVASGLMYAVTIGPYVRERTAGVVPVYLTSMILASLFCPLFIRVGGVTGAALALLSVYLLQSLALAYVSNRLYPISFEWNRLARVLAILAVAYFGTRFIVGAASAWWAPAVLLPFVVIGLFASRVFVPGDLRRQRRSAGELGP